MSETNIPEEVLAAASDVETKESEVIETAAVQPEVEAEAESAPQTESAPQAESATEVAEEAEAEAGAKAESLVDKTLAELSEMFRSLKESADSMMRSKEAENIKSAFYKLLGKLKGENPDVATSLSNPFEAVEENFKAVYADYKKERAEFNRQQEAKREENLLTKKAIIDELKALVEKEEDASASFPAFRELQNRWREAGPVPVNAYRDINDTYQFYVEKFYDMVKISRDLRDLDFQKNLEAKEKFCEAAEKLAENENVVNAFHELQKLHEQWKEFGPVAKEKRDDIWNRFKAATAVINKRYQAHFEGQKEKQQENLEEKTKLCEQVEAIAEKEVKSSGEWNQLSTEIEDIQKKWRTIGFATKKENQKIYDRFRAACDKFFARKREYYSQFKDSMNENMEKKLSIIEKVEALKDSKEWKKTTEAIIALQKEWKEIGAVPRKKSEQLWKRFRAACDEFFAERDKNSKPENDYYGNLRAKKALIDEINAYEPKDAEADRAAAQEFAEKWRNIGFVPYKEKESIQKAYSEAIQAKFPDYSPRTARSAARGAAPARKPVSEKDRLEGPSCPGI